MNVRVVEGGSVTAYLDVIVPALAGVSFVMAVFFLFRAFRFRSLSSRANYGVAQQEALQAMRVDFVRTVAATFVGLILFGVIGLSPGPSESEPAATTASTAPPPSTHTPTARPSATTAPAQVAPTEAEQEPATPVPTVTFPSVTETPTAVPSITPIPEPVTATVASGVGVWLRSIPSTEGEQLKWVFDGTILTLLPGFETADDLDWQEVRTPDGNEGWVAAEFIIYGTE
jgi:hypothetical protein